MPDTPDPLERTITSGGENKISEVWTSTDDPIEVEELDMRTYSQQKAGLTRAVNRVKRAAAPERLELARRKLIEECTRTVCEWNASAESVKYGHNVWPDDWHRWERALQDAHPWRGSYAGLEELDN
jgi:hypothetical protein